MTFPVLRRSGLSGVAAALTLTFGALLPASQASADIIYSGATSIAIPVTTAGIYLNVVTGVSATTPGAVSGWDINPWGTGSLFVYAPTGSGGVVSSLGGSATGIDNLALGTMVDGSFTMSASGGSMSVETGATAFMLNSSANYIGFKFLNESTGMTNYGWMQFSIGSAFNNSARSIVGYAYDNTGAGIAVGAISAVPEPASAVLALAGLAGLGLWRSRRRA